MQVACLECVACVHYIMADGLPAQHRLSLDTFTCVVAQQANACQGLHHQNATTHAASAAAHVHAAAIRCACALAHASAFRRVALASQLASILQESTVWPAVATEAQASLAVMQQSASSAHVLKLSDGGDGDSAEQESAEGSMVARIQRAVQVCSSYCTAPCWLCAQLHCGRL